MRLAAAFLAALATTSSFATPAAEACGGDYNRAPTMFVVASHHGRTFVLLGGAVPEGKHAWKGVPMTYDPSEVAPAPALARDIELTLVGAKRTRTLATRNQVFIKPAFEAKGAMTALEIPGDEPMIAIQGKHQATWTDIESIAPGLETIAWAQNPGFTPPLDSRSVYVSRIKGTDIELISAYGMNGGPLTTYVRAAGAKPWGGYAGSPLGVVTVDGERYLVLVSEGRVTPVRV